MGVSKNLNDSCSTTRSTVSCETNDTCYSPASMAGKDDLAIIGMSGRFPGADCGCFINNPASFDTHLFNMSPREARQTDPTHRILLMVTYEALQNSGYAGAAANQRVGTYFGQATDDWRESNASQDIGTHYIPATQRVFGPGRLNYHFKWDGPCYSIDTACSSGATAVEMACKALQSGDIDVAVAGGGNIMTGHEMYEGLSKGGFLSRSGGGACKVFDAGADGYCRGEAVGVVVLKRLESAIRDNDNIRAVIRSVETNHSAHAISITHPHSGAQQELFRRTLQKAGVNPSQISYVELHGTGTRAGDSIECQSVVKFFDNERTLANPLYVGSIKGNIGHGEAAAGISSLIKSVLMLQGNVIPPHCGVKTTLNATMASAVHKHILVARQKKSLGIEDVDKKRILINNFNATGGNTSILLEEFSPRVASTVEDPRPYHIITISGHTPTSFEGNKKRLEKYLEQNPCLSLADLSYSVTSRKLHNNIRSAYSASTVEDLLISLKKPNQAPVTIPKDKKSIVFMFPGQGSDIIGRGKDLFKTCPHFRQSLLRLNGLCQQNCQESFLDLIVSGLEQTPDVFSSTKTHLAIVSLEIALADLWRSWGLNPTALIGHSLGEYAALCVAEVLSVPSCLRLVAARARLLQEMCQPGTHAMLAVQEASGPLQRLWEQEYLETCEVACLNGPSSTVIGGERREVETLESLLKAKSVRAKILDIPYAFHTVQVDPILDAFKNYAASVEFKTAKVAVASSLTGKLVVGPGVFNAEYLGQHTRNVVNFTAALHACTSMRYTSETIWVECGVGSKLLSMAEVTVDSLPSHSIISLASNSSMEWETVLEGLCQAYTLGVEIAWKEFHQPFEDSLRLLELPTYAFDCQDYWIQNRWSRRQRKETLAASSPSRIEPKLSNEPVITACSATEPKIHAAIQGHLVEGVGLCPSSVYLDMALTTASNTQPTAKTFRDVCIEVKDVKISSPLVVVPGTLEPEIQITTSTPIKAQPGSSSSLVKFTSLKGKSRQRQEHATYHVLASDSHECQRELRTTAFLVRARMATLLTEKACLKSLHYLQKKMIYRLFSTVVSYSEPYQNITDIYLNTDLLEAVATIEFKTPPSAPPSSSSTSSIKTALVSPYWSDTIIHLAGFLLNGGSLSVDEDVVYISSGWKNLCILNELEANTQYRAYTRISEDKGEHKSRDILLGDVYLFLEGEESIVVACTGLVFQRMPRRSLRAILGLDPNHDQAYGLLPHQKTEFENDTHRGLMQPASTTVDFRQIIADETGYSLAFMLDDETSLHHLGIDSLLTNAIVSRINHETDLTLSTSLFSSCSTIGDVRRQLTSQMEAQTITKGASNLIFNTPTAMTTEAKLKPNPRPSQLHSNSILIQGPPASCSISLSHPIPPTLFLIADGAGSGASYTQLAPFLSSSSSTSSSSNHHLTIYALESPFLTKPQEFLATNLSFQDIASLYLAEMRRLQPRGPYLLGGWSMGGMYAYEVARQLLLSSSSCSSSYKEEVLIQGLILLDTPCPRPYHSHSSRIDMASLDMQLLEKTGLFGLTNAYHSMSASTKQHLLASIRVLGRYDPVPLRREGRGTLENVVLIWARRGLFEMLCGRMGIIFWEEEEGEDLNGDLERLRDMREWFAGSSSVANGNPNGDGSMREGDSHHGRGWEKLLGIAFEEGERECEFESHILEGDHFSIMNPPQIIETARLLEDCVRRILKLGV